jgi:hypothetical protein
MLFVGCVMGVRFCRKLHAKVKRFARQLHYLLRREIDCEEIEISMRPSRLRRVLTAGSLGFLTLLAVAISGCGGNPPTLAQGTAVMLTFVGPAPSALATQVGGGAFSTVSTQTGSTLNLTVPTGQSTYAVAYVCPAVNDEFMIEASVQDGTALAVTCPPGDVASLTLGAATGTVDAAAISGATAVSISANGVGANLGINGNFDVDLPVGTEDVALGVENGTLDVAAVKINRSQTIPGAINGGADIVFGEADATTMQPFTLTNLPPGFLAGGLAVRYLTANGTNFNLTAGGSGASGTYPAVPIAATKTGDFYSYSSTAITQPQNPPGNAIQTIEIAQTTTSGGGPVVLAFPAPWSFSGPAPSGLPTFNFNYAGFSGMKLVAQQVTMEWATGATRNLLSVTATASFQNGSTSLTIPDMSSLSGFFPAIPSGTQVSWIADIYGGSSQQLPIPFSVNVSPNGSSAFVQNTGIFTTP